MSDRYPYITNPRGHIWRTHKNGEVDIFGLDIGHHNGPICIKCGYSLCQHCNATPDCDCPEKEEPSQAIGALNMPFKPETEQRRPYSVSYRGSGTTIVYADDENDAAEKGRIIFDRLTMPDVRLARESDLDWVEAMGGRIHGKP